MGCPSGGYMVPWYLGADPRRWDPTTVHIRTSASMMLGLHPIVFLSWSFGPLFPAAEALLKLGALSESVPPRPPRRSNNSSAAVVQKRRSSTARTTPRWPRPPSPRGRGLKKNPSRGCLLRIAVSLMGLQEALLCRDFLERPRRRTQAPMCPHD